MLAKLGSRVVWVETETLAETSKIIRLKILHPRERDKVTVSQYISEHKQSFSRTEISEQTSANDLRRRGICR